MGQQLFDRIGRGLVLTEAGALALSAAEPIFAASEALEATFREARREGEPLRVGVVATLSRNFQRTFLEPVLRDPGVSLHLTTGGFDELIGQLAAHKLDVVLANRATPHDTAHRLRVHRLARQPVSIVACQPNPDFRFPEDLQGQPMILPGPDSALRLAFDLLCRRLRLQVQVRASVDDMATMRLLVQASEALALLPSVVVRDELRQHALYELCVVPELTETFWALTVERGFPHPRLAALLDRDESAMLALA